MKDFAALLQGIASLVWPMVAFVALLMFRSELKSILGRLRKGKAFGTEVELSESLAVLERGVAGATGEVPVLPEPTDVVPSKRRSEEGDIVAQANGDPRLALILIAGGIEKELREILAVTGIQGGRFGLSSREMLHALQERGLVPPNLSGTIDAFWDIRNRIVHARGGGASDDDTLRALDSGLSLLRLLQAIPRATYVVLHPGARVFLDSAGTQADYAVQALLLEERGPGGVTAATRAFPTTRTHFRKGTRVAWEWNPAVKFGESWYKDPESGELKYGWTQSMEFVGRLLEDV